MTISIPTLTDTRANLWARITAELPELSNAPPVAVARILSDAIAAALHQTNAAIPQIAELAHPATSGGAALDALAAVWEIQRQTGETDEQLRERLHDRIANPTTIGTIDDWRFWALNLDGVTRTSIVAGDSHVRVGIVFDGRDAPAATADDIAAALAALQQYKPAGAELSVFAIPTEDLAVTVSSVSPDTETTRAEVTQAIKDAVTDTQQPGDSVLLALLYQAGLLACDTLTLSAPAADQTPENASAVFTVTVEFA